MSAIFKQGVRTGRAACAVAAVWLLNAASVVAAPVQHDRLKDNLYGVKFATANDGWVVGSFGSIFHTADAGRSWQPQASSSTEMLYDVDFVDGSHGWVVGRSGTVLTTADGGKNWSAQTSGTDKHLFAVDFVDAEFGVAVGDWGAIFATRDGGKTWESRQLDQDVILNDVVMIDRVAGYIVGERGTVLATEDGGATWVVRPSGIDKTFFGAFFADKSRGWVVGIDALILATEDGAQTWTVRNGSTELRELEQVGFAQAFDNPSIYTLAVAGDKGYAAGEIGAVFLSDDGGRTWKRGPSTPDSEGTWYRAMSVVPEASGAIVGAEGQRLLITGGQVQWPEGSASAAEAVH